LKERGVRRQVLAYLRSRPDLYVNPIVASVYGRRGAPDLTVCARGRFVAIETKAPDGVQSPIQKATQQLIEAAGGTYLLVRSVKTVRDYFEKEV